jgi:predicted short-subunit dehydrogenase-like oxidoreductase (DUF2520 family)
MKCGIKSIVVIGVGNVGTHLALLFAEHGISVTVACRNTSSAKHLSDSGLEITSISRIPADADLYLLCLKDSVINEIADSLPQINGIVAHTSGSVGIEGLSRFSKYGVFYPFQTFRKEIALSNKNFPILIEASDVETEQILFNAATELTSFAYKSNTKERSAIHAAGVFVSNFSNLMYECGWKIAEKNGFDAEKMLRPLIDETASRLKYMRPLNLQTGPAIRNDVDTMHKHLETLKWNPDLYNLYKELSNILLKQYGHEKLS